MLVVGAGGLGAPVMLTLARAGIGAVGIVDDDEVERTNLHRQILFRDGDVGTSKIEAAARAIRRENGSISVETHPTRFLPHNGVELAKMYDVVLEGSDNFPTKFLVADACHIARRPVVHASALGWIGTVLAVGPTGGPCYRCIFEDIPRGEAPNCATAGVLGPVVGVVGAIQADLALRFVDGGDPRGSIVTFDGKSERIRKRTVSPRKSCLLCGPTASENEKNRQIRDVSVARYVEEG